MPVPRFEPITTERLRLRPVRPDDTDALWERRNDPTTSQFQAWEVPYSREKAEALVASVVAHDGVPPDDGWFQVAVDALDGEQLGDLAVRFDFGGRSAEIGYTIGSGARGRGVATEAADALATWLFDTVQVTRVSAMMHPENLASVRVAERIGMVFEGHTRNSYWVGDENSDDWIYGMTPDDRRAWVDRPRHRPDHVELVEITHRSLSDVERLATHRSQRRLVAPVAQSFADALVPDERDGETVVPWYRAIVADGVITGFVMTTEPMPTRPVPYLWRLLVDRLHQRRGIGGAAVDLVIDRVRSLGAPAIEVSWVDGPGSPAPLYLGRGFVPTGDVDDGEIVARLDLNDD